MSIFRQYRDVDEILIKFLDVKSLCRLSQTNCYYKNKLAKILNNLRCFFDYEKTSYLGIKDNINDNNKLLLKSIIYGKSDVVKYIYTNYQPDLHYYDEYPFQLACKYCDSSVVEWMISLDKFDIKCNDNLAYKYACESRNLAVIKILEKLI